ncbi:MAG: HNH endonuclease [Actinomycetes bacterium]
MAEQILTQEQLHEVFDYIDGHLYWKKKIAKNIVVGSKAGWLSGAKNYDLMYQNKTYKIHRLIFAWHYGYFPKIIDHIDGNPLNNKINNLREATHSQNLQNSKLRKDSKSGEKGVTWDKKVKKWRVSCVLNKKQYFGGYYKNLTEAIESVRKLRTRLHMEFARYK